MHFRACRRRVGALVVVCGIVAVPLVVGALTGIDGGASATEQAVRGAAFQATDTLPPPPGCDRVIVIGDSLMDNAAPWLRSELTAAGFDSFVDAQPSRRIPQTVRAPYSGVKAALAARQTFGDAECWVVALGSNDLFHGGGDIATANALLDEMLAAVSPGASVWWVNVNYHRDPRTSFDFIRATRTFNQVVADRAAAAGNLTVIDWYTLSEANLQWFFDPVHVNRTGSIIRAQFTVAALPPPAG